MATKQAKMNAKLALRITSGFFRLCLNLLFYVVVILCIVNFSKVAYNFAYQVFGDVTQDEEPGRDAEIKIRAGESTMSVANKLDTNRIIADKNSFYVKAKLYKYSIKPGTYVVNSSMTYADILTILSDDDNSVEQVE